MPKPNSIKGLKEQASKLNISLAELIGEYERGGQPDKSYKLTIRFSRMDEMVEFVRNNWSMDEIGVYRGNALDPEFKGFGRAPANYYVVRSPQDPYLTSERID